MSVFIPVGPNEKVLSSVSISNENGDLTKIDNEGLGLCVSKIVLSWVNKFVSYIFEKRGITIPDKVKKGVKSKFRTILHSRKICFTLFSAMKVRQSVETGNISHRLKFAICTHFLSKKLEFDSNGVAKFGKSKM